MDSLDRAARRREAILDGALAVFRDLGPRGATMQEIARRAGVAKPTLYAYFPDKEAVFRAVVDRVHADLDHRMAAALAAPGGTAERIAGALAAKAEALHDLLAGSPHAGEILADDYARGGADPEAGMVARTEARIARVLAEAGVDDAAELAPVLLACAHGIEQCAPSRDQIAPWMRLVATRLLAGAAVPSQDGGRERPA